MTFINCDDLTVSLGGVMPLRGLTAELTGRINGIIGPNGAGKTTLLNAIGGFVNPLSGDIRLDGTSISRLRPDQRARLGVSRTFQQVQMPKSITALENVRAGRDHQRRRNCLKAEEALELCRFKRSPQIVTGELTGLERRQVELARAIVNRPQALLLDEPTAGLSEDDIACMQPVIAQLPSHIDVLVVLVAHDLILVRSICDRALALDFGELLAAGDPDTVLSDDRVRAAYLGINIRD